MQNDTVSRDGDGLRRAQRAEHAPKVASRGQHTLTDFERQLAQALGLTPKCYKTEEEQRGEYARALSILKELDPRQTTRFWRSPMPEVSDPLSDVAQVLTSMQALCALAQIQRR